jgi:hypothetical protein
MVELIREITKLRKSRAAATGGPVLVRIQPDMAAALDAYRRGQPDIPGRPEAMRRLVETGLAAQPKAKKTK